MDLEQQLRQNLKLRAELGAKVAKANQGMAYRLGWVLYWICLVLAGGWAAISLWLITTTGSGTPVGDIHLGQWVVIHLGQWVVAAAPPLLLYGLGRALRYVLSGE